MMTEIVKIDNGVYEIYIRAPTRVVSFKAKENVIRRLDLLIREHNLGSRSRVFSMLAEALVKALEEADRGCVKRIALTVEYVNERGELRNATVTLIPATGSSG